MPVQFLTAEQRADFGRYVAEPTAVDLARYFHLDDADHQRLAGKRGNNRLEGSRGHNRLRIKGSDSLIQSHEVA